MFTLSGNQPHEQKTMKVNDKKGERMFDVEKQTTDELKDRLSGEKVKREYEEEKEAEKTPSPTRTTFEALVKEGKVSREVGDAVYDVEENLAPKYGVDIRSIMYEDIEQVTNPATPEGRLRCLAVFGLTKEEIDEAVRQGQVFQIYGKHEHHQLPGRGNEQGWSEITIFPDARAADVYHEFAHAADRQSTAIRQVKEGSEQFARRVGTAILAGNTLTLGEGGIDPARSGTPNQT